MVGNEEADGVAVVGFDVQARKNALDSLKTSAHVVGPRHTLADVVEEQAEAEQFRLLQLAEDLSEPVLPGFGLRLARARSRGAESLQVLDGFERMLVHRVAVVEIADHQGVDSSELREQGHEQSQAVHGAQSLGGARQQQDRAQVFPDLWICRRAAGKPMQRLLDPALGFAAGIKAVAGHHLKETQQQSDVVKAGSSPPRKDAAAHHGEVRIRDA